MKKLFIGIDFSKEKVDVAVIFAEGLVETSVRVFNEFKNSVSGYKQLVKWVEKNANGSISINNVKYCKKLNKRCCVIK